MTFLEKLIAGEYRQLIEKACVELKSMPEIDAAQLRAWYGKLTDASSSSMAEEENTTAANAENLIFYIVGSFADIIHTCYEKDKLKVEQKEATRKLSDLVESLRVLVEVDKKGVRARSTSSTTFAKLSRSLPVDEEQKVAATVTAVHGTKITASHVSESGIQTTIEKRELLQFLEQLYKDFTIHPLVKATVKSETGTAAEVMVFPEYFTDQLMRMVNGEKIVFPESLSSLLEKPVKQQAPTPPVSVSKLAASLTHLKKEDEKKKSTEKPRVPQKPTYLQKIPLSNQQATTVVPRSPRPMPAVLVAEQKIPAEDVLLAANMIDSALRSVNKSYNVKSLLDVIQKEKGQNYAAMLENAATKIAEKRVQKKAAKSSVISGITPSTVRTVTPLTADYSKADLDIALDHPGVWAPKTLIAAIEGCAQPSGNLNLFKLKDDRKRELARTILQYLHGIAVYSGAYISDDPPQRGKMVYPDHAEELAQSKLAQMNKWWRNLGFKDKDFALIYGSLQKFAEPRQGMLIAEILHSGKNTDLLQLAKDFCKYVPTKSASSEICFPTLPSSPHSNPLHVPPEPVEMVPLVQPKKTADAGSQTDKIDEKKPLPRVIVGDATADTYNAIEEQPTSLKLALPKITKANAQTQTDAQPASPAVPPNSSQPKQQSVPAVQTATAASQTEDEKAAVTSSTISTQTDALPIPPAAVPSPSLLEQKSTVTTIALQTDTINTHDESVQTENHKDGSSTIISTLPLPPAVPPKTMTDGCTQTEDEKPPAAASGASAGAVSSPAPTASSPASTIPVTEPLPRLEVPVASPLEQHTFLQRYLSNESLCNTFALFIAAGIKPDNVPLKPENISLLQDLFKFIFNKETFAVSASGGSRLPGFTKFWEILKAKNIICFGDVRQDEIKVFDELSVETLRAFSINYSDKKLYQALLENKLMPLASVRTSEGSVSSFVSSSFSSSSSKPTLPTNWQVFFEIIFGIGDKPSYAQKLLREQLTLEHLKDFYKKEHGEGDLVCGGHRQKGFQDRQTFQDQVEENIATALGYDIATEDDMMKFAAARVTREWEKLQRVVDPASKFDLTEFNDLIDNIMWQRNQEALHCTSDSDGVEAKNIIEARIGKLFEKLKDEDLPKIIACVQRLKSKAAAQEKQDERSKDQEKEQEAALTAAVVNLKSALISLQRCMWHVGYSLNDDSVRNLSELRVEKADLVSKCQNASQQQEVKESSFEQPKIVASTLIDIQKMLEKRQKIKDTGRVSAADLPGVARGLFATYDRTTGIFTIPARMMVPSREEADPYAKFNRWCFNEIAWAMGGGRWGMEITSITPKTMQAAISLVKSLTRRKIRVSFDLLPDSQKEKLQHAIDESKKDITPLPPFVAAPKDPACERAARAMSLSTPAAA